MQNDNKDDALVGRRMADQSQKAFLRGYPVYTEFLTPAQIDILRTLPRDLLSTGYELFGGYESAERQMAVFLPDALYLYGDELYHSFPIDVLCIRPVDRRFAGKLIHRDFLGAALGTGVRRSVIGDLIVDESGAAYMFVCSHMTQYMIDHISSVGKVAVQITPASNEEAALAVRFEEKTISLSSVRLDALVSGACSISRTNAAEKIRAGQVLVNGRVVEHVSASLKEGTVISVRGYGKFVFDKVQGASRKNRLFVQIRKYK